MKTKIASLLLMLILPVLSFAQVKVDMADQFRAEGKIYVVIAILGIIFLGIMGYLISLDRKITKLEKAAEK